MEILFYLIKSRQIFLIDIIIILFQKKVLTQVLSKNMYIHEDESQHSTLNEKKSSKYDINPLNFQEKNQFQKSFMKNNSRIKRFLQILIIVLISSFILLIIYFQFNKQNTEKATNSSTLQQIVMIRQSSQNSKIDNSLQSTVQLKQELKFDNQNPLSSLKTLQIDIQSAQHVSKNHKYFKKNQKDDHHIQDKKQIKNQQKDKAQKVSLNIIHQEQPLNTIQYLTVNQILKKKQQNYNQNQNQKEIQQSLFIIQNQKKSPLKQSVSIKSPIKNFSVPPYMTNYLSPGNHGITSQQVSQAKAFLDLKNLQGQNDIQKKQRAYYQQKYRIFQYDTQLPICVVIPSYNNVQNDRYKLNMKSIIQQQYKNFHIVFIDDGSTDQTFQKTQELLIEKNFPRNRVRMIKNQQQKFAMNNLRRAAMEFCKPEQIFIVVDGDDELIGRQVFKLYNALFQNTDAYFVYTNFLISKKNEIGYSRSIPFYVKQNCSFRTYPYVVSHLRAFYTKLFQLVDQKDLQDQKGQYYRAANDVAISLPILQMSGQKVEYFPQLTYYYNSATGYNNHVIRTTQQRTNDKKVRKKQTYQIITNLNLFQSETINKN